jgi:hypothetical protein
MAISNRDKVGRGLETLRAGLAPFVERELKARLRGDWRGTIARHLAPIFPPNLSNRAEAKRRFGVDFFPAAAPELGSGQPFLRFLQPDREGHERGVLTVELRERR